MKTAPFRRITAALFALATFSAPLCSDAADAVKIPLKDFKFKVAEGVSADLVAYDEIENKLSFYTFGRAETTIKAPKDGEYIVSIRASCDSALDERAKFRLFVDDKAAGDDTTLESDTENEYTLTVKLTAGERKLGIAFTNDAYKEGEYDRNLFIHGVSFKARD